jgi:hypothetical protein
VLFQNSECLTPAAKHSGKWHLIQRGKGLSRRCAPKRHDNEDHTLDAASVCRSTAVMNSARGQTLTIIDVESPLTENFRPANSPLYSPA